MRFTKSDNGDVDEELYEYFVNNKELFNNKE
jgi:hypothetical protein